VLLCLSFTAVHTFYWTDLRMRAPLMPFVALVAAAGLAWLTARRERRKALFESGLCSLAIRAAGILLAATRANCHETPRARSTASDG
jgi:hypothetical protein